MCDRASFSCPIKFRIQFQPQTLTLKSLTNKFHQTSNSVQFPKISHQNPRSNSTQTTNNLPSEDNEQQRSTSFDILELKREIEKDDDLIPAEGPGNGDDGELRLKRGGKRQLMRRSSLLAKQVISVRTARSLGFVSELWVDARSWMVVLVEVRPNLLSGEIDKFLLEDVCQVGDVVLVEDESLMENELKMIGLNTLVSTCCLFVEDVLEVTSDTVTVEEGAGSRVQRLTKGIWDTQNVDKYGNDVDDYYDFRRQRPVRSQSSRSSRGRKFPQNERRRR